MKKIMCIIGIMVFGLSQFLMAGDIERMTSSDWEAFSANLVKALASDNEGLKISAMQHINTYHQYLDVNEGVFDVVRVYRMHKNQKVRQLAAVTLHHMKSDWAMYFLKRNLKFEDNETIKRQILDCLHDETDLVHQPAGSLNLVAER